MHFPDFVTQTFSGLIILVATFFCSLEVATLYKHFFFSSAAVPFKHFFSLLVIMHSKHFFSSVVTMPSKRFLRSNSCCILEPLIFAIEATLFQLSLHCPTNGQPPPCVASASARHLQTVVPN